MDARPPLDRPPRPGALAALRVGTTLAAIEALVHIAAIVGWADRRPPLLVAALAAKLAFCWGAARRGPGSMLVLLLWEGTGALALGLLAGGLDGWVRWTGTGLALVTLAVLVGSLPAFPSPTLPVDMSPPTDTQ